MKTFVSYVIIMAMVFAIFSPPMWLLGYVGVFGALLLIRGIAMS